MNSGEQELNQVDWDHCKNALSETRQCDERNNYIALAAMCGITAERLMAYDNGKTIKNIRKYIEEESNWEQKNKDLTHKIFDIRKKAVHAEYASEFDHEARQLSQNALGLLKTLIKFLHRTPAKDMKDTKMPHSKEISSDDYFDSLSKYRHKNK